MKRLLPVLVVLGCGSSESVKSNDGSSPPSDTPTDGPAPTDPADPIPPDPLEPPGVDSETLGEADARPAPEASHRALKRMRLSHLQDAMESISGGVTWSSGAETYWETYAETLGVADYQSRLTDNREATIMFQKFLDDAATHTCAAWVSTDATADTPSFFSAAAPDATDPTSVTDNLVALRLRIHGRDSTADDAIIAGYQEVFETVLRRTEDPIAAWTTVCVGFFTHPDFFMY